MRRSPWEARRPRRRLPPPRASGRRSGRYTCTSSRSTARRSSTSSARWRSSGRQRPWGKGVLTDALRRAERPSLTLLGVCTGVIVLHAAGVIRDRPCTTHHRAQQSLKDQGADVRTVRVVDDGNLVCAGGVSSGIDGALWLLERELGSQAATSVEALMEYERRGTVLRTAHS
ncbi:DJ-1/PfpI family protein [Streptomyces sp. NPDC059875]|uniref:DJ-1/PfpI family protein n=1 Tax=unclassified Streptomyces TaxID=2593676 RepID=UPI00364A8E94